MGNWAIEVGSVVVCASLVEEPVGVERATIISVGVAVKSAVVGLGVACTEVGDGVGDGAADGREFSRATYLR